MAGRRLGEFEFIDRLLRPLAAGFPGAMGLRDDTARISPPRGHDLVLTTDALVESVHFLRRHPAGLIARKALRVNLSDLAAAGAEPFVYQMALALPDWVDDQWLTDFCGGLAVDQTEFGIALCGGDTVSTPGPLAISITAMGSVPAGNGHGRGGAKVGDLVFVTGTIGDGALGLLAETGKLTAGTPAQRRWLANRYLLPIPRTTLGPRLLGLASAAMDVSDGLIGDIEHIASSSGVAVSIDVDEVPLSPAARAAVASDPALIATVLTGGDDYELLFTAPPLRAGAVRASAAAAGVRVTRIGEARAGAGVDVVSAGSRLDLAATGYRHR